MKNKKGFTLIELLAVVVILIILSLITIALTTKITERGKINAFIDEANTFAKAAYNKYTSDKQLDNPSRDDLFNGTRPGRVCYSIQDDLLDRYVTKDKKEKYSGSVEYCYASDCTYQYKLWFTDGKKFYINGRDTFNDASAIETKSNIEFFNSCEYDTIGSHFGNDHTASYDYRGYENKMTILKNGNYKLEAWGAQGGDKTPRTGGHGAYAYTEVYLKKGDVLYINVGGKGQDDCTNGCIGGYNGGGSAPNNYSSGGGATSIALNSGTLDKVNIDRILLVAAGGGGVSQTSESGYKHGVGNCMSSCGNYSTGGAKNGSSGGGGYTSTNNKVLGQGGTSFIGNNKTTNGVIYCYKCAANNDTYTKTVSTNKVSATPEANTSKLGNGFFKITYLSDYVIAYDLNGGTVSNPNPKNYSEKDSTITINNPAKNGYDFLGWADQNVNLFQKGSTLYKEKTYLAGDGTETEHNEYSIYEYNVKPNTNYVLINSGKSTTPGYAIYNSQGQRIDGSNYNNKKTVTFTTPSTASLIRFSVVTSTTSSRYDKYNFKLQELIPITTIPSGSVGDKSFKAYFAPIVYTITYNLSGGALADGVTNPSSYTIESPTITLNNPTKEGYRFTGWSGSNGSMPYLSVSIPNGSTGNKTFKANMDDFYTVTLDYNLSTQQLPYYGKGYIDTGFLLDLSNDFKVDLDFILPELGRRYLLFGTYSGDYDNPQLNLELNQYNQLRVYQSGQKGLSEDKFTVNEDTKYIFDYKASDKSYINTYKNTTSDITISGNLVQEDYTKNLVRVGIDFRGGSTPFYPFTIKGFKITSKMAMSHLPVENVHRPDYIFDGWYTSPTGGTKVTTSTIPSGDNVTYYAHWTKE